jgi:hypothetical protein
MSPKSAGANTHLRKRRVCMDAALAACTPVFLVSPAVEGIIERQGTGASLKVEWASPLRLQNSVSGVAARVMEEKREAVEVHCEYSA